MTYLKTKIEDKSTFSRFAKELGLDTYVLISKQTELIKGRNSDKILEDAFEAFIGAMITDFSVCDCNSVCYECNNKTKLEQENEENEENEEYENECDCEGKAIALCGKFFTTLIDNVIDMTELIANEDNYKDQLMRFFQKNFGGRFPKYFEKNVIETINENGIISKKFHMYVEDTNGKIIGEGISRQKKDAEQKAAQNALLQYGIVNGY